MLCVFVARLEHARKYLGYGILGIEVGQLRNGIPEAGFAGVRPVVPRGPHPEALAFRLNIAVLRFFIIFVSLFEPLNLVPWAGHSWVQGFHH